MYSLSGYLSANGVAYGHFLHIGEERLLHHAAQSYHHGHYGHGFEQGHESEASVTRLAFTTGASIRDNIRASKSLPKQSSRHPSV